TPGATMLDNLAAALTRQRASRLPYALGMRFPISDSDALLFSHTFYSTLAGGSAVEEALRQARSALIMQSKQPWAVGVPVLYTSLKVPVIPQSNPVGVARIEDHQPPIAISTLTPPKGGLRGRTRELKQLAELLAQDLPVTIHGGGGSGKTALVY